MTTRDLSLSSRLASQARQWRAAAVSIPGLPVLFGTALVASLYYWFGLVRPINLLDLYAVTKLDGAYLYNAGASARYRLLIFFCIQGGLYFLGWWAARRASGRAAWAIILGGSLVAGIFLLFLAPFDALDIYDNIVHARLTVFYHANPFIQVGNQYPNDPFTPYMAWKFSPAAYGPLWEILGAGAAFLAHRWADLFPAGDPLRSLILANVIAFKLIPGLFAWASAIVAGLILRRIAPQRALSGTLLLAWNPVVLYETWGNGHNDMAMVFWMILAVAFLVPRRYTLAVLALVTGALVKFIPVLLIPAAGLMGLRALPTWRARLRFTFLCAAGALGLVAISFAPFWKGFAILSIGRRVHMFSGTLPASIYFSVQPKISAAVAAEWISLGALILTLVAALWEGYRASQNPSPEGLAQAGFNVLAFYLLVTCLWFQHWYTVWLVGLAPFLVSNSARRMGLIFSYWALFARQFTVGPFLYWPHPRFTQPWFEIWFTVGVLGPVWAYVLINKLVFQYKKAWIFRQKTR